MQILSTKLLIPPMRPRLVKRGRLLPKLSQGRDCGFLLVSAPAGYGKTTLLSGWISHLGQPAAWLSLDERDNDPVRFLKYLAAALQKVQPAAGEALEAGLQSMPLLPVDILLTPVVNCLVKVVQPFWLVLDDYHVINNDLVHTAVRFLLENRPASMQLAIATRADPPLPLSRLRVRSQVVELRLADLRFTLQETAEFLDKVMGIYLSHEDLSIIEAITEGWVAGLQMAGLSLQGKEDASAFIKSFSGENRYILDFLFDEVFNKLPEDLQNFLMQTSILKNFCGGLCDAVTQRQNSQGILEIMEKNNLFLVALDEQKQWYRYHNLFGDLIKSRCKQVLAHESAILQRRASAWYARANDMENAIGYAIAAKDYDSAADLIEKFAPAIDRHNKEAMLANWMDNLPREILEERPWLCVHRAWGYYWTGKRDKEEEWLQLAEKSIDRLFPGNDLEKRHIEGHIAVIRAMVALTDENIPRIIEMGQKSLELLPEDDDMRCETAISLGGAYWALGDSVRSEQAFEMARAIALKSNNTLAVPSTCYVGIQQVKQGRLQDALATFSDALSLATLADATQTPVAGFANVKLGSVMLERDELENAFQYLNRGVEQCVKLGQPDVLTDAYVCLSRYYLAVHNFESASASIEKADQVTRWAKVDAFVLCGLDEIRLKAWLARGNLEAVSLWVQNCGLSPDGPFNYLHDLHHQNLARALVAQGVLTGSRETQEQAGILLSSLQTAAEHASLVNEQIKILLLHAVNDMSLGSAESAIHHLARAVILAEPGGYVRIFLEEGEILMGMLATLALDISKDRSTITGISGVLSLDDRPKMREYVLRLLSAFKKTSNQAVNKPYETLVMSNVLVEVLSSREIEVLKLLAQGFSDKKIAENLVIARETVHKHLKNIYNKLDVHSRTEAVARAGELGLL